MFSPAVSTAFSFALLPLVPSEPDGNPAPAQDEQLQSAIEQISLKSEPPALSTRDMEQESGWNGGLIHTAEDAEMAEVIGTLTPSSTEAPPKPEPKRDQGFRFRIGNLDIRPLLQLSTVFDDNIFLAAKDKVHDLLTTVAPGVALGMGDYVERKDNYLGLVYSPSFVFYGKNSNLNTANQSIIWTGQSVFQRLTLGGSFQWEESSTADRDIGGRVTQDIFNVELRGNFTLTEKLGLELRTSLASRNYQTQVSSNETGIHSWIVYKSTTKLDLSAGLTLGNLEPSAGRALTYQQLLIRARIDSTEKLNFTASAGIEFRQFGGYSAPLTTPIFDLGSKWSPFDGTEFTLSTYRHITNSAAAQGIDYLTTGVSSGIRKRVFKDLNFELSGGYEHSAYFSTDNQGIKSALDNRADDYSFGRVALSLAIPARSLLSVYYLCRSNHSNASQYSFNNNQVGLEWKISF